MLCGRSLVRWRKESGALAGCARADCCSRPREPAAGKDVLFAGLGETALRGIVVFSSLTPHMTGPNTTSDVRKAYILQYAPTGAMKQLGDAAAGPAAGE
ncbi:MAG: hypothetical protein IIC89_06245, partial [Chloroflexi bacterium]|nr:hypothetical protein [Chloroflexota bacterium]